MSFNRGQTDRFGRPIPASPGYQILINADGSEVQQRNRLILPASMVVSDSDDNDASSLALTVSPSDMSLAANSVLGNPTGVTAAPTALPATATGLGVLAAATQAALTALIAVATQSLAGLLSAADKTKIDKEELAFAANFNASSVAATWAAGRYRALKIRLTTTTGNAASPTMVFGGVTMASNVFGTAGYLTTSGATGAGTGTWTQADQWVTSNIALLKMGQSGLMVAEVTFDSFGASMVWRGTSGGQLTVIGSAGLGGGTDATGVTGLTITFGGATVGRLEIVGVL